MTAEPRAVALSMLNLVPGAMGGSEVYARELVRELAARAAPVCLLLPPVSAGFSGGELPERIATEYPTGASTAQRLRALGQGLLQRRALADRVGDCGVLHYPFTMRLPAPRAGQRSVVSLLDVQHRDLPQLFSRSERVYRSWAYDASARRADAVLTISDFCKQRIVATLGIDPARIHVAPLGVRQDEFRPRTGPREEFLLYPARGWPHKNHVTLFEAFTALRRDRPALRLVLTGASAAELPPAPEGVEVRGQVSRAELVELYATAALMVFPSRYEGFGLPVVEAMASGCPVVAARAGSLPEVVGDAGELFDANDAGDMAQAIIRALARSAELQERGLVRAARYTWQGCADVHLDVYRALGD